MEFRTKILIAELSHDALYKLADHYRSVSDDLRAAAERKAAALCLDNWSERRLGELRAIPELVRVYTVTGQSTDQAVATVGRLTGLDEAAILAHLDVDRRKKEARAAREREAEIIRLHGEGVAPGSIAKSVGAHRSTVYRIIRRCGGWS